MLRRSALSLSGGHGESLPTSKAAAHLDFQWVMSRPPPTAPLPDFCRVAFAKHPTPTKFSFTSPVVCWMGQVPIKLDCMVTNCVTQRASVASIDSLVRGTYNELAFQCPPCEGDSAGSPSQSSEQSSTRQTRRHGRSGVAMANITQKAQSEYRMKNRRYDEFQRPVRYPPHVMPQIDLMECEKFVDVRANDFGKKTVDMNRLGYQAEYIPWNLSPPGTRQLIDSAVKPGK